MTKATSTPERKWWRVENLGNDTEPAEILIYESIGKDFWSNEGQGAKEFAEVLKGIPRNRNITVGINSIGGNVWEGMAIYNLLQARRDRVTTRNDGVAASIASVILCAGSRCIMPRNAMVMIHDPWTLTSGTADDHRKAADALDKFRDTIATVYETKTGKSRDELVRAMTDETWLTGDEARAFGFADELTDEISIAASFDFSNFRRVPGVFSQQKPQQNNSAPSGAQNSHMDKTMILALLRKHGADVKDDASDESIVEALNALAVTKTDLKSQVEEAIKGFNLQTVNDKKQTVDAMATMKAEMARITAQLETERKQRIERVVDVCISEARIPGAQRDKWVNRAIVDETVLDDLKAMPSVPVGGPPFGSLEVVCDSIADITTRLGQVQGMARAAFYEKHRDRIAPVLNTNTVDSNLKTTAVLQEVVRAFATRLMALRAFSSVFESVALKGDGYVGVPYYALATDASEDWNASNGYDTARDTATSIKRIQLNKRKYQMFQFTSDEWRRQPYLSVLQHVQLKTEKLAADVFADVLSVVTASNFATAGYTGPAAGFFADDVVKIRTACNKAQWPHEGRSLILNSDFDGNLLVDPAVKNSSAFGGSEAIRDGMIPKVLGFDYYENPNIPTNSENLAGAAVFRSAILVATSPIEPAPAVMADLQTYQVFTDLQSGISFEYKQAGDWLKDTASEIIECNYGYTAGEATAIQRIVTA